MLLPVDAALRSFSRTIFADQVAGDALVASILGDISVRKAADFSTPVDAFRELILRWRDLSSHEIQHELFTDASLIQAMGPPPMESRMALILSDVIGFSFAEIDTILGPLETPTQTLVLKERSELSVPENSTALIIEDEPLIAADLEEILDGIGITVIGQVQNADTGKAIAVRERPDLILADYNLDGSKTGLDAIYDIQRSFDCAVVFVTGIADHVLRGEEIEPDFVVVKPYSPETIRAAVTHCLQTIRPRLVE